MKEDYLWDKTGSDPEIEKLENALQVFRYKETAPPGLPAKVIAFPVQSQRRAFRFVLAAAACIAFGVISLGIWFQILRTNMVDKSEVAAVNSHQGEAALPDKPLGAEPLSAQNPVESEAKKIETSEQFSKPKPVRTRKSAPLKANQKEIKAQVSKQTKSPVFLTEEEKYAYNQLMLALSITGSKLKIVKDKVEGLDEKIAAAENVR